MKVYTLGYQGLDLATYVSLLKSSGIGVVLDVREKAWSRKPGFSKTALGQALSSVGIVYIHLSSAGNPSENRKTASTVAECLRRYRKHIKSNPECLAELLTHIKRASRSRKPACLTCYEELPEECHRSILLESLSSLEPRIKIVHLFAEKG